MNKITIYMIFTILALFMMNQAGFACVNLGGQALQFTLEDINGKTYSLQDSSHKTIVLFFMGHN